MSKLRPLIAIITYNRPNTLREMLESMSWYKERVVVFDDHSKDGIANITIPPRMQVQVRAHPVRGGVSINSNRAIKYFQERKNFDVLFLLNDDLRIKQDAFKIYLDAIEKTKYHHFCQTDTRSPFKPSEVFKKNGVDLVRRITGDGTFMTITRKMVETLGGFDPGYGLAGGEHYDYSRRAAAAGFCIDSLDVLAAQDLVVTRQYYSDIPRSLSLQDLIEAKQQGSEKWLIDMNEEPVIWKEIIC